MTISSGGLIVILINVCREDRPHTVCVSKSCKIKIIRTGFFCVCGFYFSFFLNYQSHGGEKLLRDAPIWRGARKFSNEEKRSSFNQESDTINISPFPQPPMVDSFLAVLRHHHHHHHPAPALVAHLFMPWGYLTVYL